MGRIFIMLRNRRLVLWRFCGADLELGLIRIFMALHPPAPDVQASAVLLAKHMSDFVRDDSEQIRTVLLALIAGVVLFVPLGRRSPCRSWRGSRRRSSSRCR